MNEIPANVDVLQEVQQTRPCYLHKPETLCKIIQQLAPLPQAAQLQQAQAAAMSAVANNRGSAPGDAHPAQGRLEKIGTYESVYF